MDYSTEIIVGLTFIIVLLLLMVAGLSSELTKQRNTVRRISNRLDDAIVNSEKAVRDIYSK